MGKNMVKGNSIGKMVANTLDNSRTVIWMDKGTINGQMGQSMKVLGAIIEWMVMENSSGLMGKLIKDCIEMVSNMDMVSWVGQMGNIFDVNGRRDYNTVPARREIQRESNKHSNTRLAPIRFRASICCEMIFEVANNFQLIFQFIYHLIFVNNFSIFISNDKSFKISSSRESITNLAGIGPKSCFHSVSLHTRCTSILLTWKFGDQLGPHGVHVGWLALQVGGLQLEGYVRSLYNSRFAGKSIHPTPIQFPSTDLPTSIRYLNFYGR